ncbi:MAG: hypothetical protein OXD50_07645 [Chloroflexi bacterium]|nr:hypothetical protein [Chloroflexota bacterium]
MDWQAFLEWVAEQEAGDDPEGDFILDTRTALKGRGSASQIVSEARTHQPALLNHFEEAYAVVEAERVEEMKRRFA